MRTTKQEICRSEIAIEKSVNDTQMMGRNIENILNFNTTFWNQMFNIQKSAIPKLRLISIQDKRERLTRGF